MRLFFAWLFLKGPKTPVEKIIGAQFNNPDQTCVLSWVINSFGTSINVLLIELKINNINAINKPKSTLLFKISNLLNLYEINNDEIKNSPVMGNAVGRKNKPKRKAFHQYQLDL